MLKVRKIEETPAEAFAPNGESVGKIEDLVSLMEFRMQVKIAQAEGYYIKWCDQIIYIAKDGSLDEWPEGFFDAYDDYLNILVDWNL